MQEKQRKKFSHHDWPDMSLTSALRWGGGRSPRNATDALVHDFVHQLQDGLVPGVSSYKYASPVKGNDVYVIEQRQGGFVRLLEDYAGANMDGQYRQQLLAMFTAHYHKLPLSMHNFGQQGICTYITCTLILAFAVPRLYRLVVASALC